MMVEPTSGNTGIGSRSSRARGYKLMVTMPESMSLERRRLLKAFGAEIVLTPTTLGMPGAVAKAEEIVKSTPHAFMPQQFKNPANPEIHRKTTAEEIWRDTDGRIDFLVCGVGTGGTITVRRGLKARNPNLKVVAVEPMNSPVIHQFRAGEPLKPGKHSIQGIGRASSPTFSIRTSSTTSNSSKNEDAFEIADDSRRKKACFAASPAGRRRSRPSSSPPGPRTPGSSWSSSCRTWVNVTSRPPSSPSEPRRNQRAPLFRATFWTRWSPIAGLMPRWNAAAFSGASRRRSLFSRLSNIEASETGINADPQDILRVVRDCVREAAILAIYTPIPDGPHSQQERPPNNYYGDVPRIIVSLLDDQPTVRIWRLEPDSFEELGWRIIEPR